MAIHGKGQETPASNYLPAAQPSSAPDSTDSLYSLIGSTIGRILARLPRITSAALSVGLKRSSHRFHHGRFFSSSFRGRAVIHERA
jgi:hypothetical protein